MNMIDDLVLRNLQLTRWLRQKRLLERNFFDTTFTFRAAGYESYVVLLVVEKSN